MGREAEDTSESMETVPSQALPQHFMSENDGATVRLVI